MLNRVFLCLVNIGFSEMDKGEIEGDNLKFELNPMKRNDADDDSDDDYKLKGEEETKDDQ